MKKLIIASLLGLTAVSYGVAHSAEPVYAKTTPNPVVAPEPETKKACVKNEKTGKEVCKTIKVHKKLEGTKVPDKK